MAELGGQPLTLRADELQLGRGESIADTARVLSRYLHAIVIRAGSHATVAELAAAAEVPVVNALTPVHHPCQALADLLTLRERFGDLDGVSVAYVGATGGLSTPAIRIAADCPHRLRPNTSSKTTASVPEQACAAGWLALCLAARGSSPVKEGL